MHKYRLIKIGVLMLAANMMTSCLQSQFLRTDMSFHIGAKRTQVHVFLDRKPKKLYRSVGIIEVSGPAGDFDLMSVVQEAAGTAQTIGCDLLLDKAIHQSQTGLRETGVLLAAVTMVQPIYMGTPSAPGRREFICGVYL